MTLTLVLTRHAKSSWDDPTLDDHDRPLNARGRRSAPAVAAWLTKQGITPQLCLASTARRAQETCALMAGVLPPMLHRSVRALYMASAVEMLLQLHSADKPTVMMVGHNPGIMYFAHGLLRVWPSHAGFERYPTNATTIIEFDQSDWSSVDWKSGKSVGFTVPRELVSQ